ncbi:MAG: hypothetical protein ACKVT2_22190 [Saprospiraceae bacterium]
MSPQLLKKVLYWLCLIIAPVILVAIELFHPAGFTWKTIDGRKVLEMFSYLSVANHDPGHNVPEYLGPQWWFTMHMIQTPMVGLVAVGMALLVWSVKQEDGLIPYLAALLTKVSAFLMIIYYTVLDAIGGIGLAKSIEITNRLAANGELNPEQVKGVADVLNNTWVDPWVGGVGSVISESASWLVFITAVLAGIALLTSKKATWPPLVVLGVFGWEIQNSHASYWGPIGFGLLVLASLWIWIQSRDKVLA